MSKLLAAICLVGATGILLLTNSPPSLAGETVTRTVRGTVVATDTSASPQTIVVKVPLPNKDVLIVGADVPSDARITRRGRTAKLENLKAGDKAELSYVKSEEGLTARSIRVR